MPSVCFNNGPICDCIFGWKHNYNLNRWIQYKYMVWILLFSLWWCVTSSQWETLHPWMILHVAFGQSSTSLITSSSNLTCLWMMHTDCSHLISSESFWIKISHCFRGFAFDINCEDSKVLTDGDNMTNRSINADDFHKKGVGVGGVTAVAFWVGRGCI